jgi:thiamine biosynthesis lipoprotein
LKTAILISMLLLAAVAAAVAAAGADVRDTTRSAPAGRFSKSFYSMGTLFEITVNTAGGGEAGTAGPAVERAFETVARLDTLLSAYKSYSEISTINRLAGGPFAQVDPLVIALVDSSIVFWRVTGGAFDPTVGPLLDLWGFRGGTPRVPDDAGLASVLPLVDASGVEIDGDRSQMRLKHKGQELDLGGIAKGFALDRAAYVLRRAGIENALLNFGGNLLFMGEASRGAAWRAGIAHPRSSGEIVATFSASDVAVSTSGDYENFFISDGLRYSHIMDPRTGRPAAGLCSATVIASAGTASDALSTAIVVLGPGPGMKLVESIDGVEAVIILTSDLESPGPIRLYVSSGLIGSLEPSPGARLLTLPHPGR